MNNTSLPQSDNPLYEKLRERFSYRGLTVGEMMLCRAKNSGGSIGSAAHNDPRDLTAEATITRATQLPKSGAAAAALPFGSMLSSTPSQKLSPCALLASLLCLTLLVFLLFSGIRQTRRTGLQSYAQQPAVAQVAMLPDADEPVA